MGGAERVVDVDVGERRVALGQLRVVLRLALLVADVLEHHDVAVGHVVEVDSASATSSPSSSLSRSAAGRSDSSGSRSFGRPRWAASSEPRALLAQLLQRRQRRPDAGVVGDVLLGRPAGR